MLDMGSTNPQAAEKVEKQLNKLGKQYKKVLEQVLTESRSG